MLGLGQKALLGGLGVLALLSGYGSYRVWHHFRLAAQAAQPNTAVVVTAPPTPEPQASPTPAPAPTPLPASVFVQVPYTAQSPYNQWGAGNVHEEYCEAAALLMVSDYFKGDKRPKIPPAEADSGMASIVSVERKTYPGVLDLPLDDIGAVGTQMFSLHPTVTQVDPDQIKLSLAQGRPVIIPVMTHGTGGAKIAPNYGAVNVYHVILLIGYDTGKGVFYTNDAGFVQGQNYAYSWTTLSSAIDAQTNSPGTKVRQGRVMLIFSAS
jgi:hypothetical protein